MHRRSGADLRGAIANLKQFIATILVSKHRFFVWIPAGLLPETRLVVIARDDDTTFGILSSALHTAWTLKTCQYHGVGNDPVYTPGTTFETFPFPDGLTPNIPAATYADDPRAVAIAATARALVLARDRWLNPPELVDRVPEVVLGFPDRLVPKDAAAAVTLKGRTLTGLYNIRGTPEGTWFDNLHRTLDAAVAAAYGWPADISTEDALGRLLALNHARHAAGMV
jgi:type II restriction/modification system DNA methylase subunit YeeA